MKKSQRKSILFLMLLVLSMLFYADTGKVFAEDINGGEENEVIEEEEAAPEDEDTEAEAEAETAASQTNDTEFVPEYLLSIDCEPKINAFDKGQTVSFVFSYEAPAAVKNVEVLMDDSRAGGYKIESLLSNSSGTSTGLGSLGNLTVTAPQTPSEGSIVIAASAEDAAVPGKFYDGRFEMKLTMSSQNIISSASNAAENSKNSGQKSVSDKEASGGDNSLSSISKKPDPIGRKVTIKRNTKKREGVSAGKVVIYTILGFAILSGVLFLINRKIKRNHDALILSSDKYGNKLVNRKKAGISRSGSSSRGRSSSPGRNNAAGNSGNKNFPSELEPNNFDAVDRYFLTHSEPNYRNVDPGMRSGVRPALRIENERHQMRNRVSPERPYSDRRISEAEARYYNEASYRTQSSDPSAYSRKSSGARSAREYRYGNKKPAPKHRNPYRSYYGSGKH